MCRYGWFTGRLLGGYWYGHENNHGRNLPPPPLLKPPTTNHPLTPALPSAPSAAAALSTPFHMAASAGAPIASAATGAFSSAAMAAQRSLATVTNSALFGLEGYLVGTCLYDLHLCS